MRTPIHLELEPKHLKTLETIANSGKSELDQALRAKILLKKAQGLSNATIASDLAVNRHTVELWVKRYQNRDENDSLDDLLSVAEGRGAKSEIFGEAKTWIIVEACTRRKALSKNNSATGKTAIHRHG